MLYWLWKRWKFTTILLLAFFAYSFVVLLLQRSIADQLSQELALARNVTELQERVRLAEQSQNSFRKKSMILQVEADSLIAMGESGLANKKHTSKHVINNKDYPFPFSPQELNQNLDIPSVIDYMPHVLGKRQAFEPALKVSQGRHQVSLVLGVPTVQRSVKSYLMATLRNLIDNMNAAERNDTLIVVFIGEVNIDYARKIVSDILISFGSEVQSGLIDLVVPRPEYYPAMNDVPATLDDTTDRFRWRSKQNLDFAYLMMYCRHRGLFYVQLEDDIMSVNGFVSSMKQSALEAGTTRPNWFLLDFCPLGFIGKLFRSKDLLLVVHYLIMFQFDKPSDWLLQDLVRTKVCRLDFSAEMCTKTIKSVWILFKTSQFQHIGSHSSLKGKLQKLKVKHFGTIRNRVQYSNPPAHVTTTISVYQKYTIERAYNGLTFFWGLVPRCNDSVVFNFTKPIALVGYLFQSGHSKYPQDLFSNTSVDILPTSSRSSLPTSADWITKGWFNSQGVAEALWPSNASLSVSALRLFVQNNGSRWVILDKIHIRTK